MSRIVFVTWNGGGNLLPALGIARELDRRGHAVAFLGQETQRNAIETACLAFTGYQHQADQSSAPPTAAERLRLLVLGTWMNTSLADDLAAMLAREPADAVVIDCMLAGVLARSGEYGVPAAVLVHGLFQSVLPVRDAMLQIGNQLRTQAGLAPLETGAMTWENKDLVLVTTLRELDGVTADPAPNVRYIGPVFDWPQAPPGWQLPWPDGDPRPLVLVSLSTMPGPDSAADLQHFLDAAGGLDAARSPLPPTRRCSLSSRTRRSCRTPVS
jgi:UDP:flavonoid glycosyltransferase YjiC (YdhE family)